MKTSLVALLSVGIASAWFGPVRIDHEDRPGWTEVHPLITLGPGTGSSQPIYVVMRDDSSGSKRAIMFQRSTDAGRTWLPADVLVHRARAMTEDITTDPAGNIYIVYDDLVGVIGILCVRSSDGGATWSEPANVDLSGAFGGIEHVATDAKGNLYCIWIGAGSHPHVFESSSTDGGVSWSPRVRVDDDTSSYDGCYPGDVFVQPGTDHCLVTAEHPRYANGYWTESAYLYRSTDMGQTFQPGVRLDTFADSAGAWDPQVVADSQHVICDYDDPAEVRTLYTLPDTWGSPHLVGHSYRGPSLAISADGRVHAALMEPNTAQDTFHVYYTSSLDYGVTWSSPEFISGDTAGNELRPDIAADSAGSAYVVWYSGSGHTMFATNSPAAIAEQPSQQPIGVPPLATVIHNVLFLAERPSSSQSASYLLDIGGRQVMVLKPGANDVRALAPGVYFVRGAQTQAIRKVVVTR